MAIVGGEFAWSKEGPSTLSKVNFAANKGKLVGIVGAVGSVRARTKATHLCWTAFFT